MKDYSKVFDMVADAIETHRLNTEKTDTLLAHATSFDQRYKRMALALRGLYDEQTALPSKGTGRRGKQRTKRRGGCWI